ncbi:hypothetical protein LCGC14_2375970, partial [marine sediment metagenome]
MFLVDAQLREIRYKFETVDSDHERAILEQLAEGYVRANEIQIEAPVIEVGLAKTGCPQFAAAAFKA